MDTVHFYADSLGFVRDTMYLYIDSINLLQDTALAHNIRLTDIENDTTHFQVAWDSVAIFHRRFDWHTDSIKALIVGQNILQNDTWFYGVNVVGDTVGLWKITKDNTLVSALPVEFPAFRFQPDSRYSMNVPIVDAANGDTVSFSLGIDDIRILQLFGISDGAGSVSNYGGKVDGSLDVTGDVTGANINNYYQKELTADAENNIPVGFPLGSKTKVFYNGVLVEQDKWTGIGTSTIALVLDTRKYDVVTITN
jgi:hypothetical protein